MKIKIDNVFRIFLERMIERNPEISLEELLDIIKQRLPVKKLSVKLCYVITAEYERETDTAVIDLLK